MSLRPAATVLQALLVLSGAALAAGALLAAPAYAGFGPIQLQSVGPLEQFEEAGEPAISGDDEYLAFQGTLGGVGGVWRRDLQTGQLQLVAAGASAPSISSEGRYVSFTSSEALLKRAHAGSNVYVRDMASDPAYEGPCTEAMEADGTCPYELASALSGTTEGLTYGDQGAIASGHVSLSADGREVVFVTESASDLTSHDPSELSTPPDQVVVRYLNSDTTMLVSAERNQSTGRMNECPGAGGAATPTECPVAGGAVTPSRQPGFEGSYLAPGAALSGDGSTVAWLGANIPAQAPTLNGERQQIEFDDRHSEGGEAYDEPLWRRIAEGPTVPTRRMVGGGDPLAPGCPPEGTIEVAVCQGPYPRLAWESTRGGDENNYGWLGIDRYDGTPQLSADGWTAVLVGDPDGTANVFAVDMHEGRDRVEALRELTPEVPAANTVNPGIQPQYVTTAGDVYEVAISPDGSRIAFTTQRQQFPLAPLSYDEEPPSQLGVVELYEVLGGETLERVTHGPDGGASLEGSSPVVVTNRGAAAPSFTRDDRTLAFADTASNLVYGDANRASDVFTVTGDESAGTIGSVTIGQSPPSQEPATPQWRLSVVAVTHPGGDVTLDVVVPGAGLVSASATAVVPVAVSVRSSRRSQGSAASRRRTKPSMALELRSRMVATAQMSAAVPGLLELPLRVSSRYTSLLGTKAGIYATVRVTFTGAGGPPLTQTLALSMHGGSARAKRASKRRAHGRSSRGSGATGGKRKASGR
jgi:Tol biopolymer transport system component